jgi:hypothetical protein
MPMPAASTSLRMPSYAKTYTAAAKRMFIKLPMYLFSYMGLDFDGGKSITWAIGRGGP